MEGLYSFTLDSFTDPEQRQAYIQTISSIIQNRNNDAYTPSTAIVPSTLFAPTLSDHAGSWTTIDQIRLFNSSWRYLPEDVKTGNDELGASIVETALRDVKISYSGLTDLLAEDNDHSAIIDPISWSSLSHATLHTFIDNFHLPILCHGTSKPVIAVAIPNGPHLGVACLATSTYYRAAPLNIAGGSTQFQSDVRQVGAKGILVFGSMIGSLGLDNQWYRDEGIDIFIAEPQADLTFTISKLYERESTLVERAAKNGPDDIGLILMTSGTSGNKKIVPMTIHGILSGVTMVIDSWGLQRNDCCLNMMPLNHVGGLVRNLFAPIISGGSTICCTAFDPNLFWDIVEYKAPTWYYASPTMHSTILMEAPHRPDALKLSKFRLICNAAGGLLPSLAVQLRDTFHAVVLPSYGMTECMPISTPPLNYALERTGTSGVTVGPDLAILDNNHHRSSAGVIGNINVRGSPVFPGYLTPEGSIDKSAFDAAGWFSTGDMGYMDEDGFLYVTGRSKEVINRGGELISPLEIEDAIMKASQDSSSAIYGRVTEALAFSTSHDVLQEVPAVVLVVPKDMPRPDLQQLKDSLRTILHQPKWPEAIIYMDSVPKKANKVVRTKLSERLNLPSLNDEITHSQRHFQAVCPPPETPLDRKIQQYLCRTSTQNLIEFLEAELHESLDSYIEKKSGDDLRTLILAPKPNHASFGITQIIIDELQISLQKQLHGYLIPSHISFLNTPFPRLSSGAVDGEQVMALLNTQNKRQSLDGLPMYEIKVREIFSDILSVPFNSLTNSSDFFEMGGDSLRAGKFISAVRRELNVRMPIQALFSNSSIQALCDFLAPQIVVDDDGEGKHQIYDHDSSLSIKTHSSTNPFVMLAHLTPMTVIFPMRRALEWTILLYALSILLYKWPGQTTPVLRVIILMIAVMISRISSQVICPIFGILFKWIVIGKYREGLYPMWGFYHTRWWLTQKVTTIAGMGIFEHSNSTRIWYLRLMGAKIGAGVSIDGSAILGEYDLISIGNDVRLDSCICRPFGVERNTTMYLGRIHLSEGSHVGFKSIVAPGARLPPGTCIGPNSSSWETECACEANADLSKARIPEPSPWLQVFVGAPFIFLIKFLAFIPRAVALYGLVQIAPDDGGNWVTSTVVWFSAPTRVGWHFLAYLADLLVGTFVYIIAIVVFKRAMDNIFGKMQPGMASQRSEFRKLRMWIMDGLLPNGDLTKFTEFFGTHYEATSMLVRALGGRVGRRVYWPGTGPSIQDFDMIDIGDDVVFGSRSHIVTSDGTGSHPVLIGAGTMIADRVILLPGTVIGENVVMGSGALTKRDTRYPDDTVWVGSKNGEAICLTVPGSKAVSDNVESQGRGQSGDDSSGESFQEKGFETPGYSPISSPPFSTAPTPYQSRNVSTTVLCNERRPSHPLESKKVEASVFMQEAEQETLSDRSKRRFFFNGRRQPKKPAKDAKSEARTPFGRAFYEGKASFHVLGMFSITLYSFFINIFAAVYWNSTTIATVQVLAKFLKEYPSAFDNYLKPLIIYAIVVIAVSVIITLQAILAMGMVIAAKWLLMGRRQVGSYDWDKSSYCQRWQILLAIEKIRRKCFGGYGIVGLITGSHYLVMFFRALGADIGKDCALFAGGKPSLLFTEPELLHIGDRVAIDDASVVAHINSRGNFNLNELTVGKRSVLRSGSRLLSGSNMEDDSVLLEHTLIVGGNVVEKGSVYQGWPAEYFAGRRGDNFALK